MAVQSVRETVLVADIDQRGHENFSDSPYHPETEFTWTVLDSTGEPFLIGNEGYPCVNCGRSNEHNYQKNETGNWAAIEPCPLPEGVIYQVTLNVPSGKLVVSDNLLRGMGWEKPGYEEVGSLNSSKGQEAHAKAWEKKGLLFGSVIDCTPQLFLTDEGKLILAEISESDEDDVDDVWPPKGPANWTHLATIELQMWAYCIADYDTYVANGGNPEGPNWDGHEVTIVDVPAGTWTFTHYAAQRSFQPRDTDGALIIAAGELTSPDN